MNPVRTRAVGRLEPCAGKLACTVLRGGPAGNGALLPDGKARTPYEFGVKVTVATNAAALEHRASNIIANYQPGNSESLGSLNQPTLGRLPVGNVGDLEQLKSRIADVQGNMNLSKLPFSLSEKQRETLEKRLRWPVSATSRQSIDTLRDRTVSLLKKQKETVKNLEKLLIEVAKKSEETKWLLASDAEQAIMPWRFMAWGPSRVSEAEVKRLERLEEHLDYVIRVLDDPNRDPGEVQRIRQEAADPSQSSTQ
jgi:hypothetical protein